MSRGLPKVTAIASGVVLVLLAGCLHWWNRGSSGASAAFAPGTLTRPQVKWPAGSCYHYAIDWQSSNRVSVAGVPEADSAKATTGSMALALALDGDLVLCSHGVHDGRSLLTAQFGQLRRLELSINGKAIYRDIAAAATDIVGPQATFDADAAGTIQRLSIDKDPSGLFRHLIRGALLQLQLTVPVGIGRQWEVSEQTLNGLADSRYSFDPARPRTLQRTHLHYDSLAGMPGLTAAGEGANRDLHSQGVIELEASGLLKSVRDEERLSSVDSNGQAVVADSRFVLTLGASTPLGASRAPSLSNSRPLSDRSASPNLQRRMLEQRVAGMTFERVQQDFTILAAGADIIEQKRWIWRTSGLLMAQPELCDGLVAIFGGNDVTAVRALVADLLASAGHPRAQAALRAALSLPDAEKDPSFLLYVQRFGFVPEATQQTLDFLWARFDAESSSVSALSDALLYTLGSAIGRLRASGQDERAQVSHERLVYLLTQASSPHARKAALAALGNAGFREDFERIGSYAANPDEDVRSQVAWSLRKIARSEVHGIELALLGDPVMQVQGSAIQVLSALTLAPDDFATLDVVERAHPVHPTNCAALVALLGQARVGDAHATAIYRLLLERSDLDQDTRARVTTRLAATL